LLALDGGWSRRLCSIALWMLRRAPSAMVLDAPAGVLYGNTDADEAAEFAIELTGVTALSASDFSL